MRSTALPPAGRVPPALCTATGGGPVADRSFSMLLVGGSYFEAPRWHDGRCRGAELVTTTVDAPHTGLP